MPVLSLGHPHRLRLSDCPRHQDARQDDSDDSELVHGYLLFHAPDARTLAARVVHARYARNVKLVTLGPDVELLPETSGMNCTMGEMKERMLRGDLYIGNDPELAADFARAQELVDRYNRTLHAEQDTRDEILRELLGHVGEGVHVRAPFRCDYGTRVSIGARTFLNYDCLMLDEAAITIGSACQIAPRVQFLAATHPIDAEPRRTGWESGEPIALGDNVWLGGGVVVCPGVTIGDDTVVGAGAVVTRDLPPGVVAAGVPARVIREIGERDRIDFPHR